MIEAEPGDTRTAVDLTLASAGEVDFRIRLVGPARITGSNGDDTITGGSGLDTIWGGSGNDALYGLVGSLDGESGNDILIGGTNALHDDFTLSGGAGDDILGTSGDLGQLYGGDGNDTSPWSAPILSPEARFLAVRAMTCFISRNRTTVGISRISP